MTESAPAIPRDPNVTGSQDLISFAPPKPEDLSLPRTSELRPRHVELLSSWQDERFPSGEPLSRQGNQFIQEVGEVGELVFGLPAEKLDNLYPVERYAVGNEIADVVIAGVGKLKVLGYTYEELRKKKETAVYDPKQFSELERWQIDANGGEIPLHLRLRQFAKESLRNQKAYELLGSKDASSLSDNEKKKLAEKVARTMTLGLSLLNTMGESFDKHFGLKFAEMEKKYDKDEMSQLVAGGMSESEAMVELKRRWSEKKRSGEVILYTSNMAQESAAA